MDQIVNYVTSFAAVGLFFATCALVAVTVHHARSAEKMANAADRLGVILDDQGGLLAEVAELNALVSAMMAVRRPDVMGPGPYDERLKELINELLTHRITRAAARRSQVGTTME